MEKDSNNADMVDWMGVTSSLRKVLSKPLEGPDTLFRFWMDPPERVRQEDKMTDEQLAYCHVFLRTDLHVLTMLALVHKGSASASDLADFLKEQDLSDYGSLNRIHIAPILRELSHCAYSGIQKESDHPQSPYSYNSSVEGLAMQAGYLYDFSKKRSKSLTSFIGTARGGPSRDGSTFIEEENISPAVDRIHIVRYLVDQWKNSQYDDEFSTHRRKIENDVGISPTVADSHITRLFENNLLVYETHFPQEHSFQRYKLNLNAKVGMFYGEDNDSFVDYIREYIFVMQSGLTTDGALQYLLNNHQQFSLLDSHEQAKLKERIKNALKNCLSQSLICSDTRVANGAQSYIGFPGGKERTALVDYAYTLNAMQREDKNTVEEGIKLGAEISYDRQGITTLLRKSGK